MLTRATAASLTLPGLLLGANGGVGRAWKIFCSDRHFGAEWAGDQGRWARRREVLPFARPKPALWQSFPAAGMRGWRCCGSALDPSWR